MLGLGQIVLGLAVVPQPIVAGRTVGVSGRIRHSADNSRIRIRCILVPVPLELLLRPTS